MGLKVSQMIQCLGKVLFGLGIAFYRSWQMTLVMQWKPIWSGNVYRVPHG